MSNKYKVGQIIEAKYRDVPPKQPYRVGQYVDVFDTDTNKKVACFRVLETDGKIIKGKVITTYGHRRRNDG